MARTLATYKPGTVHGVWDSDVTVHLPVLHEALHDPAKVATPTARICWERKEYVKVDSRGRMSIPYGWGGNSPYYLQGGEDSEFPVDTSGPNRSLFEVEPKVMFGSTGFNDFELTRHNYSLIDLVPQRMIDMNRGLSFANAYETLAAQGSATELAKTVDGEVDIDGILLSGIGAGAWAQNSIRLRQTPVSVLDRFHSIPFFIRPHIVGHEIQGIESGPNKWWRSIVKVAQGPGASQEPQDPPAAVYTDESQTDPKLIDMVDTDTNGSPVPPSHADLDSMLGQMQIGSNFCMIGLTSIAGVNYLARNLFNYGQFRPENPLMDMGITYTQNVVHNGFNCVYVGDPMMDRLWPNSIIFFDPDQLVLGCVDEWGPKIVEWRELPSTIGTHAMAKVIWGQRFVKARLATGWLLNCRFFG